MTRLLTALFLCGILGSALSACGFHLRGNYTPPDFLHNISLTTPLNSQELDRALRISLEQNNIVPSAGELQLEITKEDVAQKTSTVSSQAAVAEYMLVYTVEYRLNRTDGSVTGALQTLTLRRSYQYNTATIVGLAAEEATMVRELRREAAQQIIRRLSTLKAPPLPPEINAPSADIAPLPASNTSAPAP